MRKNSFVDSVDDPIELLDLPPRIFFALKKNDIHSIEQLRNTNRYLINGLGEKSIDLIEEHLDRYVG